MGKRLHVAFPQWQGSGHQHAQRLYNGAEQLRKALPERFERIPVAQLSSAEKRGGINSYDDILAQAERLRAVLDEQQPERLLTLGGDCGVDLVPASYLNERYAGELALLWLDAHADLNTPRSSPSGAFHGMALRSLMGEGDEALLSQSYKPFAAEQVFLLGARDFDPPEFAYFEEEKLELFRPEELREHPEHLRDALELRGYNKLHVHFDLDALDPAEGIPTCYPAAGGFQREAINLLLAKLDRSFDIVGITLTEYAPAQQDDKSKQILDMVTL